MRPFVWDKWTKVIADIHKDFTNHQKCQVYHTNQSSSLPGENESSIQPISHLLCYAGTLFGDQKVNHVLLNITLAAVQMSLILNVSEAELFSQAMGLVIYCSML